VARRCRRDAGAAKLLSSGLKAAVAVCCAPTSCSTCWRTSRLFATDKKKRRIKIVCRYQQYEAANKIVERVVAGPPKKGLIWHFQGSGKSLLMVFAAQKLRLQPAALGTRPC
jgi:type I restriction enzyme, R subunit